MIAKRIKTVDPEKKSSVKLGFKRGKETRTYKPIRAFTGDKDYGKDNPSKKDPEFIEKARRSGVDIAYGKNGLSYKAGDTKTTKEPDQFSTELDFKPKIPKMVKPMPVESVKPSESKAKSKYSSGKGPKRRLPRVDYLQGKGYGRNKKTEAGHGY